MHALTSSSSSPAAAGRGARASTSVNKPALPLPAPLLCGGPLRHPRRRSSASANPVVLARSGGREEALRALESFSAGVAARVAVVASASASDLASAPSAALSSADGGPGLRELKADTFWPTIREEAGDKLVVVDFYTQ
jgi:hypothetical protein